MANETKPTEAVTTSLFAAPEASGNVWVADQDYYEALPDGRVIQHAVKGTGYPVGYEAQIRGMMGPSETKEDVVKLAPPAPKTESAPPATEKAPEPKKARK